MKEINHDLLAPLGMVGLTILAGAFLLLPNTNADDSSVVTATITVPVSCSMTGTGMNSHTAEIPNGIDSRGSDYYPNGIGQTTLKAFCNDNEGFSIYAVGYTGDTIGNTYLRDVNLGQTDDIQTGTTFSGNSSNWAMKLGVTSGTYTPIIAGSTADTERQSGDTDYSGWAVVPSTYQRVAYRNSGTDIDNGNIQAEGASVTATYAAYISPIQKAGTYVGKVKYTLVHPASEAPLQPQPSTAGCINYFANASNAIGSMGCQSASDGQTKTLLASNFSRENYGFAGWSDAYDYATNPNANFYGPQEDITVPVGTTANGLSLYAVWVKSAGSIQNWSGCSSLASGAVTALTDQRDDETYAVAKLADGNCWMIENLRLENTGTHNSDGILAQGYGTSTTYGNFSGLADPETEDKFNSTYSANSLYSNDGSNNTINIGTSYGAYRMPRYNNVNTPTNESDRPQNPTTNDATNSTSGAGMYSYGNYYTWHAAIADLDPNNTENQSTIGTSLCPTGWHLPTGGKAYASGSTSGVNVTGDTSTFREFYNLGYKLMDEVKTAYEDTPLSGRSYYSSNTTNLVGDTAVKAFRKYPNNFIYSGSNLRVVTGRGSYASYWTSTADDPFISYILYITSGTPSRSYVCPGTENSYGGGNSSYKQNGIPIRCLVSGA